MVFRGIVKKYIADLNVGKICAKYGGTSITYGIFTPNPGELCCFFI